MAQHKDYGLIGVGNSVQLGKQGPKVVRDGGSLGVNITDEDGSTAVTVSGANASLSNHFVTKAQLDSVSADALVTDIEYNSGTVTMGTIADGTKTIQTVFSVDTVFDGNTVINVGTDSNNSLLMSAQYYDLTGSGDYITVNTVELSTTETFKVYVTQGNSTVGNGTVVVSVLDGPVTGSSAGGSSGIALTDLSVTTLDPGGNGSLTYNNSTGVFSFTPADTSSASIGGTNGQVQYNSSGSLEGSSSMTFDGYTLYAGLLETTRISTDDSRSTMAIGTKDGSTFRHNIQISNGGTSASVVLYGQLSTSPDTAGNRSFDFRGTDLYNLPLANITNVSSTAPTNGQALAWNNSTSEWEPGTNVIVDTLTVEDGVKEKLQSKSITGSGTFTFQCANGQVFHVASPAADFGCNFTDLTIDTDYATATTIVIDQGSTAYMPTSVAIAGSNATITWQGGSAPSGTANGIDVVTFSFLNVSSTVTVLGQSVSFS